MNRTDALSHPGQALRAARIEQELTLRDLAARTGLPYSTLSKLENGKMALTYDKLVRLAQGLGVDLGSLVTGAPTADRPPPAVGRRSVARAGQWPNASSERYRHHYPAADLLGKIMVPIIIEVTAEDIASLGGLVRHAGEEYLYVLRGSMELHSDLYAPLPLNAGDSVYFDSGMAHGYVRTGNEPCEVLSVCAGPGMQRMVESAGRSWDLVSPGGAKPPADPHDVSDIET
jgi:transcriptional regulator with XRE-family HTH domain